MHRGRTRGVFLAALALGGCTRKVAKDPATLRIALPSEPPLPDPQTADTGTGVLLVSQVMSTLVRYDAEHRPVPSDARSWEWVSEGRELKLVVRSDLTWSDGQPVKACQYRDGILRALDPATPAALAGLLFDIQNAAERKAGKMPEKNVRIICDDKANTIGMLTTTPYPSRLVHALAFVISSPVRKDAIKARGASWLLPRRGEPSLGTGAFTIQEFTPDRRVVLASRTVEKNLPEDRRARFSRVEMPVVRDSATGYNLYETGELDALDELPTAMLHTLGSRTDVKSFPYYTTYMVGFTPRAQRALQDRRVRQALAFAAHQDEVPQLLGTGEGRAAGWIPPGLLIDAIRPRRSLHDPARARKLFDEAGYKDRSKFPVLHLFYSSGDRHQLLMERLAHNWADTLGIRIALEPMEWKVLVSRLKTKAPELYRYAWAAVYPDPLFFLELFTSASPNNFGHWSNKDYDALVTKLANVPIDRRDASFWKDVERAQKILVEDDPALVPIYHYVKTVLVKSDVEGLTYDWRGMPDLRLASRRTQKP